MRSPIVQQDGKASWTHRDGDKYLVTGVNRQGLRFRQEYSRWATANAINLWRGTKWLVRDGRRFVIQRVYN